MNVLEYAKGVEKLVNPMEVGKVCYMHNICFQMLPVDKPTTALKRP